MSEVEAEIKRWACCWEAIQSLQDNEGCCTPREMAEDVERAFRWMPKPAVKDEDGDALVAMARALDS